MIREHELNSPISRVVYEDCKRWIEMKYCYHNVFNVITHGYGSKFHKNQWKIAYGYVTAVENLMARHCFIIDEYGDVIDPTLINSKSQKHREYVSFKILTFEEYMETLTKHDNQPSLFGAFRKEEKLANEWSRENNVVLFG
jgi:hypothetical protein